MSREEAKAMILEVRRTGTSLAKRFQKLLTERPAPAASKTEKAHYAYEMEIVEKGLERAQKTVEMLEAMWKEPQRAASDAKKDGELMAKLNRLHTLEKRVERLADSRGREFRPKGPNVRPKGRSKAPRGRLSTVQL